MITEELLEEERQRMRSEYESEMEELRKKMASEKETKAKMQSEIDKMRLEYEEKMKSLEQRAQTAKLQRGLDGQVKRLKKENLSNRMEWDRIPPSVSEI